MLRYSQPDRQSQFSNTPVHRRNPRRGAALVEMALVLPLFLMVVLGIIEFGRAMMVCQMVTNAAREGARRAIIEDSTNTAVEQQINDFLTGTLNVSANEITTTITITPGPGNENPGNQLSKSENGDLISIRVSVPYNSVSFISGRFLAGKNLIGQSSMRHE